MHRPLTFLLLCGLLWPAAHADSWAPATVLAKSSGDGQFVVRVVPGKSMGDVFGYGGQPKGPYARAEWHRFNGTTYEKVRETTLLNPIAPITIEVTNQGVLVAIDNWHNLGIGNAVVIYSPNGQVFRKYNLLELYSMSDVEKIDRTVSSLHWRCAGFSTFLASDTELVIDDSLGGRFVFHLDSGAFEYERDAGECRRGRL